MSNLLLDLKQSFTELYAIISSEKNLHLSREIRRFLEFIDAIESGEVSEEEGLSLLRSKFKSLHTPQGGLSDFHVWRDDYDERLRINQEFKKHADSIWNDLDL